MKTVALAVCLFGFACISAAAAQPPSPTPNPQSTLIGTAIAATVIIAVFAFVAYAGFKIIKKWSNSQPD
ncbi:MAG: hypothetical protein M1540_01105 [Candidatus Bathyarchaeota archaeon]|nr:hypothetical protein [Candidatus Bathyarchaeota archaeon]